MACDNSKPQCVQIFTLWLFLQSSATQALPWDQPIAENSDKQSTEEILNAQKIVELDFPKLIAPESEITQEKKERTLFRYSHLDPKQEIPSKLLNEAISFFDANKEKFPNQSVITIVDLAPRSDAVRFFLLHLDSGHVEKFHTTHGSGSDVDDDGYAESFGNTINSGKSSLGFVRTAEVYHGRFQRSLRLDGLSPSNSNLRERAVVIHGWDNVHEANVIQGRTLGCLSIDWNFKDSVIDKIKEGSFLYIGISRESKLPRSFSN